MGDRRDLWYNLKILSKVRPHERVATLRGDLLVISTMGPMEGVWRRWCGETRAHNLAKIQSILDAAFRGVTDASRVATEQNTMLLGRFKRELTAARAGLTGLLDTYERDSVSIAKITCMVEALDIHVDMSHAGPLGLRLSGSI